MTRLFAVLASLAAAAALAQGAPPPPPTQAPPPVAPAAPAEPADGKMHAKILVESLKPGLMGRHVLHARGTTQTGVMGGWTWTSSAKLTETEAGKGTLVITLDAAAKWGTAVTRDIPKFEHKIEIAELKGKSKGRYELSVLGHDGAEIFKGVWRDGTVYFGEFKEPS